MVAILTPKSSLRKIERVFAGNGLVFVVTNDGKEYPFTPRDIADRFNAISQSADDSDKDLLKRIVDLGDQVIKAYNEAMSQRENATSGPTKTVDKMLKGLKPDGTPFATRTEEGRRKVEAYTHRFPFISKSELETAIDYANMPDNVFEDMLKAVNKDRMERSFADLAKSLKVGPSDPKIAITSPGMPSKSEAKPTENTPSEGAKTT